MQDGDGVGPNSDSSLCMFSTEVLPDDCILQILKLLPVKSVARMASVCRDFRRIAESDQIWENLAVAEYCLDAENLHEHYGNPAELPYWKKVYKKLGESKIELHFENGPRHGEVQVISTEAVTIGRSRRNGICLLLDDAVSRRHARLIHLHRHFWIQDIGASNGTWINNKCIPQHAAMMVNFSDSIELGVSSFIIKPHKVAH
jgi:hypothetical protein